MSIDWNTYYKEEQETNDFDPTKDPSEIQRCLAAWSVLPRKDFSESLDVGCGDGFFCHWLNKKLKGINIEGVDVSEGRLDRGRDRYPEIKFHQGGLPSLPFEDGSYDLVSSVEVLEHMVDPQACLEELRRVSRKYVLFTVPDREKLVESLCPHCRKKFPQSGHIHSFDENRTNEMVIKAGMKLISSKVYYPPLGATTNRIPPLVGRALRKVYNLIDPRPGSYIATLATV